MKVWPYVVVAVLLLIGFVYWDSAKHRRVEEFVAMSPEIPGERFGGATAEAAAFRRTAQSLTRRSETDDVRIAVIWNSPRFFNALATAEAAEARDITRHKTLYHGYAEKFGLHSDLVFTVIMDSELFDLRMYDVKQKSLLRNDKEVSITPWKWSEARGSSAGHLEGVLSFPQRTKVGQMMIGHVVGEHMPGEPPPIWLELVLGGLPDGQEAVFRWELPPNP